MFIYRTTKIFLLSFFRKDKNYGVHYYASTLSIPKNFSAYFFGRDTNMTGIVYNFN